MQSYTSSTDHPDVLSAGRIRAPGCGRCLDVVSVTAGLLVLWPVFLLIALIVLAFDGWPVFFRQERVGRGGKPFRILKFRTMRPGQPGHEEPLLTVAGNPRITRVGRWLREFKLDELPQLWNVLVGEMSLIGPRPEVRRYVDLDAPQWQAVLGVRPGITDLATLAYVDEEQTLAACEDLEQYYRETVLPRKLALNVRYVRLRSLRSDLELILLTLRCVLHLKSRDQSWLQKYLAAE